ncbi:MAG: putative HNHc nuclease [Oscillospiraceae bacterium]|nr:putative HNHc nuclease [Oscillospiraceae bacterium]
MSTTIKGRIVGYDERRGELLIRAPYADIPTMIRQNQKEVLVQPLDSRPLSDKQRRSCYAMIGEIADYMGDDKISAKEYLKLEFMVNNVNDLSEKIFSLSNAPMSLVAEFQRFLAQFIVRNNIPTKRSMLSYVDDIRDYVYSCLINKRCCICGKKADIHHVQRIGMGRDRDDIVHEGMEALPLCREHHTEAHTMPDAEFFDKYHLDGGVVLDKTLCRIYGLKAKK